jgi:vancomycin permeability regulator SanA
MRLISWAGRLVTFRRCLLAAIIVVAVGLGSGAWIRVGALGHIHSEQSVRSAPVALVLGAQVHSDGRLSMFLVGRLELAKRLYDAGRVHAILVSGDHSPEAYDETGGMRSWLVAHGVPAAKIVEDRAGFDTYDSCHRAKRVFGVERLIVVTQSYHIQRAVTICRAAGIDADGVGDETARAYVGYWRRALVREQGADVKAAWEMLIGRDPLLLGPRESSVDDAVRLPR